MNNVQVWINYMSDLSDMLSGVGPPDYIGNRLASLRGYGRQPPDPMVDSLPFETPACWLGRGNADGAEPGCVWCESIRFGIPGASGLGCGQLGLPCESVFQ